MNLLYENQSRKIDNLGRVTIPKPIRERQGWEQNDEDEFYTMGGSSVVLSKGKMRDSRYDIAAEVLGELGLEIPKELKKGT